MYKNFGSNIFKNITFLGELSNNDLIVTNVSKSLEFC